MVDGSLIAKIMMMEGNMMTEKRFEFQLDNNELYYFYIIDNKTGKEYKYLIDDELLKLLNELAEENRQLKEDIDELDKKSDEKIRLIRENTRLKKKLKEHNDMLKWHQGGW